ncbi:hypothetical protein Anapl_02125, partial [Anas platyrhynchos]
GKHLTSGMQPRMDFWDTGREGPMVPPFTAVVHCPRQGELKGWELAEGDPAFACFPVRAAVWDTVSGYVHQQLLLHK